MIFIAAVVISTVFGVSKNLGILSIECELARKLIKF